MNKSIQERYSFQISPTLAAMIEERGEAELEINGKYYKLLSEEKFQQALSTNNAEWVERIRALIVKPTDDMSNGYYNAVCDYNRDLKALIAHSKENQ